MNTTPDYRHRAIVCGTRDPKDPRVSRATVHRVLDMYHAMHPITMLGSGHATGVDTWAEEWAASNGVPVLFLAAVWKRDDGTIDKSAGPRRNRELVRLVRPHVCLPFAGGAGTADCVEVCRKAGAKFPVTVEERK